MKPIVKEIFSCNGSHSHWALIDGDNGEKLWSEFPEECEAMGHPVVNPQNICKICDKDTDTVLNINFKAMPICESCAVSVFLQQAQWYANNKSNQAGFDRP